MSRALLVLGAPPLSAPALRWAREAGLLLVVVDPDARAAARRLAHEFQCLPPDDERALVALARRRGGGPARAGVLVGAPRWLASFARLGAGAPSFQPPEVALEPLLVPERARE